MNSTTNNHNSLFENLYVSDSGIHGIGVYTSKIIPKGSIIGYIVGKTRYSIYHTISDGLQFPDEYCIGPNLWIDADPPFSRVNHSCNPNCSHQDNLAFCSLVDINEGEELTFDYSTSELFKLWNMTCHCKQDNCRGTIGSVHSLPHDRYDYYISVGAIPSFARAEFPPSQLGNDSQ